MSGEEPKAKEGKLAKAPEVAKKEKSLKRQRKEELATAAAVAAEVAAEAAAKAAAQAAAQSGSSEEARWAAKIAAFVLPSYCFQPASQSMVKPASQPLPLWMRRSLAVRRSLCPTSELPRRRRRCVRILTPRHRYQGLPEGCVQLV